MADFCVSRFPIAQTDLVGAGDAMQPRLYLHPLKTCIQSIEKHTESCGFGVFF